MYTLTLDSKVLKRGRISVHARSVAVRYRIYRDANPDTYFNYCVKGGRDIRSRDGGRLYCLKPGREMRYSVNVTG